MTFRDNFKPREIAAKLGIDKVIVYRCLDRLKANLKSFLKLPTE